MCHSVWQVITNGKFPVATSFQISILRKPACVQTSVMVSLRVILISSSHFLSEIDFEKTCLCTNFCYGMFISLVQLRVIMHILISPCSLGNASTFHIYILLDNFSTSLNLMEVLPVSYRLCKDWHKFEDTVVNGKRFFQCHS